VRTCREGWGSQGEIGGGGQESCVGNMLERSEKSKGDYRGSNNRQIGGGEHPKQWSPSVEGFALKGSDMGIHMDSDFKTFSNRRVGQADTKFQEPEKGKTPCRGRWRGNCMVSANDGGRWCRIKQEKGKRERIPLLSDKNE